MNAAVSSTPTVREPAWGPLEWFAGQVPSALLPWLAEPGLLTDRVRVAGGGATRFQLLRSEPAPLAPELRSRLGVSDTRCLLREIEFACAGDRWIFAQSAFPLSTVATCPWLADLGDSPLGEALRRADAVERAPLEFRELRCDDDLARSARPEGQGGMWARRAVYRLAGAPIIVQEVFLPALVRCCNQEVAR